MGTRKEHSNTPFFSESGPIDELITGSTTLTVRSEIHSPVEQCSRGS